LGSSDKKWADVYATTFNGALNGNASSATKATQDGDGNVIKNTYYKASNPNGYTSNTGTVTSVTIGATGPITIDNSAAITTSGSRTISHSNSGVTAGTYKSVTVNATGHVTAGSNPTTLSGYGITDAKIANGVITLGSNTITPLTSHQDISGKVNKSGDTMTGKLTAPQIETGTDVANYFQSQKFRGQGNANTYYHAVDFGYSGHDRVDFYEYGGI
jgi:phage-related tail fiber protein